MIISLPAGLHQPALFRLGQLAGGSHRHPGRAVRPGRLCPVNPGKRPHLRRRRGRRPVRPDLRLPGARFLQACPAALLEAEQLTPPNGALPAHVTQAGGRRRTL